MQDDGYNFLESRGLVTVGGADRAEFLQGLISNDIRRVAPDRAIWAALLTPQGKYLHDFFVTEIGGVYFLDCERARLMDLGQRLSRYKLRAKVDLGIAGSAYLLQARLHVVLPGLPQSVAEAVAHAADEICPYSKATRGNIDVSLTVEGS